MQTTHAKYHIGQVLRHRKHPFRGVVFDVDAMFSNTDEWYENIPEDSRPSKDQPFYHLLAENGQSHYVAYVSEQNRSITPTSATSSAILRMGAIR
jgi:heat shock protein HspQ